MLKRLITAVAALAVTASAAYSSSDDAWQKFNRKVRAVCKAQSGLPDPKMSEPAVLDEAQGKVVVILRGSIGAKTAKSNIVDMICLYDRKAGTASVAEYRW